MHLMHTVLREFVDAIVIIFLDNFLIFIENPEEQTRHVSEMLHILREKKLYAKFPLIHFALNPLSLSDISFLQQESRWILKRQRLSSNGLRRHL